MSDATPSNVWLLIWAKGIVDHMEGGESLQAIRFSNVPFVAVFTLRPRKTIWKTLGCTNWQKSRAKVSMSRTFLNDPPGGEGTASAGQKKRLLAGNTPPPTSSPPQLLTTDKIISSKRGLWGEEIPQMEKKRQLAGLEPPLRVGWGWNKPVSSMSLAEGRGGLARISPSLVGVIRAGARSWTLSRTQRVGAP